MRRREFLGAVAAATAVTWPLRALAQHNPIVGFLSAGSAASWAPFVVGFLQGLSETGFIDGQNVAIEYRWAEGQFDRLPGLVGDLVARKVAVILATGGSDPAKAAKAATATIPIVFVSSADPVKAGIVTSINRPGGNITGVSLLGSALEGKRLGLLNEIFPGATPIGVLVNPRYPDVVAQLRELQEAAGVIKRGINISNASTAAEIETSFATIVQQGAGSVLVAQDPFFGSQRQQLVVLAERYKMPAIYCEREYAEIGGLVSYGTNFADSFRQAGLYAGSILKGVSPADLPVMQPSKFELFINLKTSKALGLEIPPTVLARADEVIE
jgi:putative ABC transport system substrate-binding protein